MELKYKARNVEIRILPFVAFFFIRVSCCTYVPIIYYVYQNRTTITLIKPFDVSMDEIVEWSQELPFVFTIRLFYLITPFRYRSEYHQLSNGCARWE